jgi:hypothetical protein
MTTGATGQLGLALPVQGELSGTWGDTVNNGITQYTNIAIAATLTLTGDGAVTLANTTGDASASNITSTLAGAGTVTAQFAMVRVSGTTTTKVVTGPSYSKSYIIDNASSYGVTFKASGQTGVLISPGEKVGVYYNATDYVKIGGGGITYGAVKTTTYTAVSNDGVLTNTTGGAFTVNLPATPSTGTQVFIADSAGTWATNNLTIGRNGSTIAGSATDLVCDINSVSIQCIYDGTTWDIFAQIGANDTAVVTLNGTQTLTNKTLTAPVLTAPVLGTPASGTVTNLTGTASININGTVGATTANTGAFTTLTTTGTINLLTVGRGAGAVATNTAVGASALAVNSTGERNIGVGLQALTANNTGIRNTVVGTYSYNGATSCNYVTAVGHAAGNGASGDYNTFIGESSGSAISSGTKNTMLGRYDGNQDGLDIRTLSNYAVISDGDGNRLLSVANGKTLALDGGAVPQTGTGITFPATQSASSDANTLDDYEEGTWTPSLGGTATYDLQSGTYTKIGKVVTINGAIRPTSLGTGSVNTLTGLPFSVASDSFGGIAYGNNLAVSVYSVYLYMSGTSLTTYGFTAAASTTPVANIFQSTARMWFSATYLTS